MSMGKASDAIKWIIAILLLVGGIVANQYFAAVPIAIRIIGWIALIAIVALVAALTQQGKSTLRFASEARVELRKVVWPTRQETIQTTLVVMVLVLVIAAILWVIDSGLIVLIGWLSGQRG